MRSNVGASRAEERKLLRQLAKAREANRRLLRALDLALIDYRRIADATTTANREAHTLLYAAAKAYRDGRL